MNICLKLCYVGTQYAGFQKQKNALTVQAVIEKALTNLLKIPIATIAAGRTDAGVHADEQVVCFTVAKLIIPIVRLARVVNNLLPNDIRILSARQVVDGFHPRYHARVRCYRYRLLNNTALDNHASTLNTHKLDFSIDKNELYTYFLPLVGVHDFTSFCSIDDVSKHKIREMFFIDIVVQNSYFDIYLYANAFLKNMIRSIVGNILALYRQQKGASEVALLLSKKNCRYAKLRAAASGLTLKKIYYTKIFGDRDYYL